MQANAVLTSDITIKENVSIGNNSIVEMGTVVTKNIGAEAVEFANPAKHVRNNNRHKAF